MPLLLTITDPRDLSDRQVLQLLIERTDRIMTDLTTLTANVTALQTAVAALGPALEATDALATRTIAALESFSQQLATLPATQAAIDALAANVASTVTALQADAAEASAANASVKAELDKVAPTGGGTP